jgi:hypothetical protein
VSFHCRYVMTMPSLFEFCRRVTSSKAFVANPLRAFIAAINSSFSLNEKATAFWPRALPDAEAFFLNHVGRSEKDRGRKVIG